MDTIDLDEIVNAAEMNRDQVREDAEIALNTLDVYMAQIEVMQLEKQSLIDAILTPEIKAQISDIESEFSGKSAEAKEKIDALTAQAKEYTVMLGESVKGTHLQAVYTKPRITWDSKRLDGYAAAHPEIKEFRTVGAPSVSIRANR